MRNCKSYGFTFIELMITLALLGLVIAGGFSFYYFADRSFMSGSEMADVQADMQLAMLRITEEVRLAHSLKVIPDFESETVIPEDDPDDVHYLFAQDGSIFLKTKKHNGLIIQGESEAGYSIHFQPVEQGGMRLDNMLAITLSSQHPRIGYELDSELQVLNLRLVGIQGEEPGGAIRFTKEFSKEVVEPVAGRRCPYRYVYAPGAPELDSLREFRDNVLAKNPLGQFVIEVYYAASPIVSSFLDYQPLARHATTIFLRNLAQAVIRFT